MHITIIPIGREFHNFHIYGVFVIVRVMQIRDIVDRLYVIIHDMFRRSDILTRHSPHTLVGQFLSLYNDCRLSNLHADRCSESWSTVVERATFCDVLRFILPMILGFRGFSKLRKLKNSRVYAENNNIPDSSDVI